MSKRELFDKQVEYVLATLPESVLQLLDETPLHIEDKPSAALMTELHLEDSDELCGLFQGVAMGEERHPMLLNSVTLFRQGILAQVLENADTITLRDLRRQIRITILHEYAHLHGLDEDEIDMLGYG